jgi:beta-lactamase regulating signal transducer with metallopeptidase domain/protocatechuate 3,4-dioxygenase beta subunit
MNAIFALGIEDRLLDVAAAVGLLLLAGMIIVHFVWQPTKRLWIIQWALVGGLVLAVGLVCPWHRFSLGIIRSNNAAMATSAIPTNPLLDRSSAIDPPANAAFSESNARQKFEGIDAESIDDTHQARIIGQKSNNVVPSSKSVSDIPAVPTTPPLYWIVRGYLLGALGMLCWLAVGQWKVRRLISRASLPATELAQQWHELQSVPQALAFSPRRPAKLLVSDDLAFPVAVGVLRPAVLLPRWLVKLHSETQLRPVLVHELAHVNRNDAVLRWLAAIFQIAFYYQPLFWFLRRQLQLCQEFLADAQAAGSASSASDYAEQLVTLLKAAPIRLHRPLPAIGIIEGRSELYRRIQMLIACPGKLDPTSGCRWNTMACIAILIFAGSLGLVTLRAADPPKSEGAKAADIEKSTAADAPANPEFLFHVFDSQGNPVVGATVTPWACSSGPGSTGLQPKDIAPVKTDADGLARIVFEMGGDKQHRAMMRFLLKEGVKSLAMQVEHPDHPTWSRYIETTGPCTITLVDATTVEVRARRANENALARRLYPLLAAPTTDWTEAADGVMALLRVDLSSDQPTRWLRIVQVPKNGPAWYSDLIDLLQQKGRPIAIETRLKPGVKVAGRLADNVPRPVKGGRVVARIVDGVDPMNNLTFEAAADIAADGTFVLESLPADENLQLIAICDGWVSSNPTEKEITEYEKRWNFGNDLLRSIAYHRCPRLYRLEGQAIKPVIAMQPTASCEITVLDDNDQPLPGVDVNFWPNQYFSELGSSYAGAGIDRLASIRTELKTGQRQDTILANERLANADEISKRYSATTDAHGVAVVQNLDSGNNANDREGKDEMFTAYREGYVALSNSSRNDFPNNQQPSLARLKPGETSHITVHLHKAKAPSAEPAAADDELAGLVVDPQGQPLEGVQVLVWERDDDKIRTDQHGRFRHKISAANADEKHLFVRFKKAGFAPRSVIDWPLERGEREILLENDTFFEGTVNRPDGKPAADVLIRANQGPKHGNPSALILDIWTETRTDANGHYRLLVEPDTYAIEIRAPGVGTARVPKDGEKGDLTPEAIGLTYLAHPKMAISDKEAKHLDIQLDPGIEFRAILLDNETGKPVPNARLWHWQYPGIEGRSDADGVVTIPSMPAGEFTFMIEAPGYVRGWSEEMSERWKKMIEESQREHPAKLMFPLDEGLTFELKPGMPRVSVELEPVETITGHVLDPDGKPVAGATVAPARSGSGASIWGDTRLSVRSAADGSFKVELPPTDAQAFNLMVHDGDYQEWRHWANGIGPAMQTAAGKKIENVELRLTRGGTIKGRTVDEHGKPLADVYVQSTACDLMENRYYNPATCSDKDGQFELRFVRPGRNMVHGWMSVPIPEKPDDKTPVVEVKTGEVATVGDVFIPPGLRERQ